MVNDAGGLVTMLNPETGALIQQGRLKVPSDRYYASPVAGDGKIYISSESGKVLVLPPGGGLDALAVNDLRGQHLRDARARRSSASTSARSIRSIASAMPQ